MHDYTMGGGHIDLAHGLGITDIENISMSGSANSRILRTTMKHSYATNCPTFYVLGMTFVSRGELPILKVDDEFSFEGRWTNPQNQMFEDRWEHFWDKKESEKYVEMKRKTEVYSLIDRTEDLMYNMLAVIDSLKSRGHQVLMYQQADQDYWGFDNPKLNLFNSVPNILNGFKWSAMKYQHDSGVQKLYMDPNVPRSMFSTPITPGDQEKPAHGHHQVLNTFLINYIREHNLL
jgi:hypothetical protein